MSNLSTLAEAASDTAIAGIISSFGFEYNKTNGGVHQARAKTLSFSQLSQLESKIKLESDNSRRELILASDQTVVVAIRKVAKKRSRDEDQTTTTTTTTTKTAKSANAPAKASDADHDKLEAVKLAIENVKQKSSGNSSDKPHDTDFETANKIVSNMLIRLRSTDNQPVVQSYGIFTKKLLPTDEKKRVVLAFLIHAGLAIKLTELKIALENCWRDGAVTSELSVMGLEISNLPLSDEGKISESFGNRPLFLVTSI